MTDARPASRALPRLPRRAVRRLATALRWRLDPRVTRFTWIASALVAALHLLGAATVVRFALDDTRTIWQAVPGGEAALVAVTLIAALAGLWDVLGALAHAGDRDGESLPPEMAPIMARVFGLLALGLWARSAAEVGAATGQPDQQGVVFVAIAQLGVAGLAITLAGVACVATAFGGRMPIVDGDGHPIGGRRARAVMQAGRAALGGILVPLGVACVVDAVQFTWTGVGGLSHAVDGLLHVPGGAVVVWAVAALLLVCGASSVARAVATASRPRGTAAARA